MSFELLSGNLVLVGAIIGLLIFLFNQLRISILPVKNQYVNPPVPVYSKKRNSLGERTKTGKKPQYTESEFQKILENEDRKHRKEMIVYILAYFTPMILAFLSLAFIFFNLSISYIFFVIAVALTLVSVFIIKFKGVGVFYGY